MCRVLTNLASDSGQFSRQLLQHIVDILTATVDHLVKKTRGGPRVAFKNKYGEVVSIIIFNFIMMDLLQYRHADVGQLRQRGSGNVGSGRSLFNKMPII